MHALRWLTKAILFAQFVIGATIAISATIEAQQSIGLEKKENCDIPGPALSSMTSRSADDCARECEKNFNCQSYVHISGWNRCFLKSQSNFKQLTITAGKKIEGGSLEYLKHHDIAGRDMESAKASTAEACSEACKKNEKCVGFAYLDGYQTCWLKDQLKSGKLYSKIFTCGRKSHQ